MKKLFLASNADVVLDLIHPLLPKPASELEAAFIPTAADPYQDKSFIDVDRSKLVEMGFTVVDVDLTKIQGQDLEKAFQDVDLVLVAGGNTFYLLDHVRKSGFEPIVKKRITEGMIYVGSSAGTVLCCPTIEGALRFDDPAEAPDLTDYTGLNLCDTCILPHAQKEKYAERMRLTAQELTAKGLEVILLNDDQAVMVEGDEYRMV